MKPLFIFIVALSLIASGCAANANSTDDADDVSNAPMTNAPDSNAARVPPGTDTGDGCGGFLGDTCSADEYCAYQPGQYCGAADASSTCKPRPSVCTKEFNPVCGCDNKTYGNACEANAAGVGLLSLGECSAAN